MGQLQHPFEAGFVFKHVDIFERNLTPGEVRTGSRCVLSKILSKNDDFFFHYSINLRHNRRVGKLFSAEK